MATKQELIKKIKALSHLNMNIVEDKVEMITKDTTPNSKEYKDLAWMMPGGEGVDEESGIFAIDDYINSLAVQPNDEIWYTSNDGNIVEPNNAEAFGVNIVSNTYVNGKGIIKFDGAVTTIGTEAFYDCIGLASINIPSAVVSIGDKAFEYCEHIAALNIPSAVTSIGNNAFRCCFALTSVSIPDNVVSLGEYAFNQCENLVSATIGAGTTLIGTNPFIECKSLASITVDSNNTVYDSRNNCNAIIKTNTYELISGCMNTIIPDAVTSIGKDAFASCEHLTSINIPNNVVSIGESAFYECVGLVSVTIGNSVTSIGKDAFSGCSNLTSASIGNSVITIGEDAFEYCTSLTTITIPATVTSIDNYAFYTCSNLASVICNPTTPPELGSYVFEENASGRKIYVPADSLNDYTGAPNWDAYASDIVAQ